MGQVSDRRAILQFNQVGECTPHPPPRQKALNNLEASLTAMVELETEN